jgi:hypothetical protein
MDEASTLKAYVGLMDEIKLRDEIVRTPTRLTPVLHPYVIYELSMLQIRMICELIALGCLVSHGDIPELKTVRVQKAYAADWIMRQLERLHSDFYPRPGPLVDKGGVPHIEPIKTGYLSKTEMIELYGICGRYLHRGSLRTVVLKKKVPSRDFDELQAWRNKIVALLNHHHISLVLTGKQLWCSMDGGGGAVYANIMRDAGPA